MEETERRVVGRRGKRRDPEPSPVITNWQTDIIENREPGFMYQFFREDEVRSKLRPSRVRLTDYDTMESRVVEVPPWEIVRRDTGPEELAGYRPDESKNDMTYLTHGGGGTLHICMKIPERGWHTLQAAQEQRADSYESTLSVRRHYQKAWIGSGQSTSPNEGDEVTPGEIRQFQTFNKI